MVFPKGIGGKKFSDNILQNIIFPDNIDGADGIKILPLKNVFVSRLEVARQYKLNTPKFDNLLKRIKKFVCCYVLNWECIGGKAQELKNKRRDNITLINFEALLRVDNKLKLHLDISSIHLTSISKHQASQASMVCNKCKNQYTSSPCIFWPQECTEAETEVAEDILQDLITSNQLEEGLKFLEQTSYSNREDSFSSSPPSLKKLKK